MFKSLLRLLLVSVFVSSAVSAADQFVYFGTYTKDDKSKGIYVASFDSETGKVGEPKLAAEVNNPSFLTIHPSKKYLLAVSENGEGQVTSFKIDGETGLLTKINSQPTGGGGPCHISTDSAGKCALVSNYSGGSTACYTIAEDGSLKKTSFIQHEGSSVVLPRQAKPHAHSVNPGPNDKFAFVADLGLDKVLIYKLDAAAGKISAHGAGAVSPGAGPRHFAFHPNGKFAYVITEMTRMVTGFNFDPEAGTLTEFQSITSIPESEREEKGQSTAEVQVHKSGKFLYGSNRGHDTIAVFTVDQDSGKLTHVENEPIQGKTPRNFGIDATGKFLLAAGQNSDSVAVFKIDQNTGELEFTGDKIEVGIPVCVKFLQR